MAEKDVRRGVEGFTDKKAEEIRRIPKRKEVVDAEREKDVNDERNIMRVMQCFPRTLPDAFNIVMNTYRIDINELAYESDVNEKTIDRIRTKYGYKPKLPTMIQLCIGLSKCPKITQSATLFDIVCSVGQNNLYLTEKSIS